jgi:hypothetical protein
MSCTPMQATDPAMNVVVERMTRGHSVRVIPGVPILGVTYDQGGWRAVHDQGAVLQHMMESDGWNRREAQEFFDFNLANDPDPASPVYVCLTPRVSDLLSGRPADPVRTSEE